MGEHMNLAPLYPWQEEAIPAIDTALSEHGRTLLVAATGTGKTRCFATYIVRSKRKRTLVLVHREEILIQARDAIERVMIESGVRPIIHVERAEARANLDANVVVASKDTLSRDARLLRFPRDAFDLVIVDEAHHAPEGTSYGKILDHFDSHVLGVTATPDRLDEKPLGQTFRSVAYEYEIDDAIRDGFLSPITSRFVKLAELDEIRRVKVRGGDFVQSDLDAVFSTALLDQIVGYIGWHAGDRQTIVFTVSVRQAQYMAATSEITSAAIHGEMSRTERARILDAYRAGSIRHLYNCAILTEGTDLPNTSCIAMARPTVSRALYCQMLGRGLRIALGKDDCLVLDFVGNSVEHDTMCIIDALGVNHTEQQRDAAFREAVERGETIPMDLLEKAIVAIERAQERIEKNEERISQSRGGSGKRKIVTGTVALAALDIRATAGRWGAKEITEAQTRALHRFGIDAAGLDRHQASVLMGTVLHRVRHNLASVGQLRVIKKLGLPIHATRAQASAAIELAKSSRWHLSSDQVAAIMEPIGDHERAS